MDDREVYCAPVTLNSVFRANCPKPPHAQAGCPGLHPPERGGSLDRAGLRTMLLKERRSPASFADLRSAVALRCRVIPEKLVHYAAETSALIYALWALALIFFIALVNVSLMLGMAWVRERTRKDRDRYIRTRLVDKDKRIAELEVENKVLLEFRRRAEASINGK